MKYGAKKGQSPKKPIKQKPIKAFTGLEIAAIGALAGMAGSALLGGEKKTQATPLNNPAAMIAPLSGFVGSKEEEKKAEGMRKGGSVNKPGLWANINRRKKLGISRPKSKTTISKEAYANMKAGFPDKKAEGGEAKLKPVKAAMGLAAYASKNPYSLIGAAAKGLKLKSGGMSGGKRYGAPPEKGPMSQGMMDGGSVRGQKAIQVKKKVFRGVF
jgi:hypothetical protein